MSEETCEQRIGDAMASREEDIARLIGAANGDDDTADDAADELNEYALSADVETTLRVVIGTGGPHDEFRVRIEPGRYGWDIVGNITYFLQDWGGSAERTCHDRDVASWIEGIVECLPLPD